MSLYLDWCNMCQSRPAQGRLTMQGEDGETIVLNACAHCAEEALERG